MKYRDDEFDFMNGGADRTAEDDLIDEILREYASDVPENDAPAEERPVRRG